MAAPQSSSSTPLILTDGSLDWSNGVNSIKTTTIASELNTNGLARSELAWLDNATVRQGGITQRPAWVLKGQFPLTGIYQGSEVYVPDGAYPYHLVVVDGNVFKVDPDNIVASVNLSFQFGLFLPLVNRVYFCQAENYMIIQAGDGSTLPLFWDGTTLRMSKGIIDPLATNASPPHTNEIPAAFSMVYYMGRVWYGIGRTVNGGDIVNGPTGWPSSDPRFNHLRDSVLCVQENPLVVGGDGFTVPTNAGNITGLAYASNINSQLGQGQLYIGTREQIYALTVPAARTDWINATTNNMPVMVVALDNNGWVNDRSIVSVNGDLFFQSLDPAIRSMTTAIRNFGSWGNVPISINEYRVIQFNDRSLLWAASGIQFDNRLLQTALPYQCPVGVAHKAIIPLNFDVISSLWGQLQQQQQTGANADSPAWEGMWEGLNVLELKEEDYGGLQRAFAYVWSDINSCIQLWEFIPSERFDDYDNRVGWYIEFPAFTFGSELKMKKLIGAEVWFDSIVGNVDFKMEYRPDGYVCWYPWHAWSVCTQGQSDSPTVHYPQTLRPSYRQYQSLPVPPRDCAPVQGRPSNQGFQFQARLNVRGYCRVRGLFLHAEPMERKLYSDLTC